MLHGVDQFHRLLAGGGVQVCQRLVKQKHADLVHHNAREADALFLPARKLVRGVVEMMLDAHQLGGAAGDGVHFVLRGAAVFQRKGDVLRHGQPDKLPVGVLQHGADVGAQRKDAAVHSVHAVHRQGAGGFAGVGVGVQPVDAARQRAFAAAGRTGDQHTLAGVDI